ncbi:MAG: flagellar motor switch protein FliN [Chitinispirillales bacterium]|nr:flagellar motor switch protein FliN [Chitinispirillales bacterium]
MSDFISQDDIDALLGAALNGDLSSQKTSVVDTGKSKEIVESILKCYKEHVKSVANLNLSRDVSLEVENVDIVEYSSIIAEKIDGEYLIVEVPFSGGCEGSVRVLASKKTFAIIADLMVIGDGTAPYSDAHKDAITEFFSQISGAFATELGGKFQKSVSAGAPSILDNVGGDILENDFAAFAKITINDFDPMAIIISPDETFLEKYSPLLNQVKNEESTVSQTSNVSTAAMQSPDNNTVANSFSSRAPKVNVDMLLDIELEVTIELGRTDIAIKRVLDLAPGSLVELDRLAGEPVELLVNNKIVAKGEVVVIDENFGVRIISLVSPEERIKSLR